MAEILKNLDLNNKSTEMVINVLYDNRSKLINQINKNDFLNNYTQFILPYSQKLGEIVKNDGLALFRFYILKSIEELHKLKLSSNDEIHNSRYKITYVTTIADNELKIKLFCLYLLVYYIESLIAKTKFQGINKKPQVGIDYEFSERIIALMQINFETIWDEKTPTVSYIWLVNPGEFNENQTKLLTKFLMTNQNIHKILHGSDSLDIPYMYNILFKDDKETILRFTNKVVDTRFLCEYFRTSIGLDRKCSIYDALLYFKTINEKKWQHLNDTHDSMGPVQDIKWNIHKLSSYHIKYALYDVLFLRHFINNILDRITKETPQYINTYKYIIFITRFIFMERRDVTDILKFCKEKIDPTHNYMIKTKGQNLTLIKIYREIIENFIIPVPKQAVEDIDISFILSVNYFKNTMGILFKFLTYHVVRENYAIYQKSDVKMRDRFPIADLNKKLQEAKYKEINYLSNMFQNEVKNKLTSLYG